MSIDNDEIIAVVVPVFNTSKEHLFQSIDSILSQEVPLNFFLKVIIIDDGSNDPLTLKALEAYNNLSKYLLKLYSFDIYLIFYYKV